MNIKKVLLLFVAAFFIVPLHAQWAVGGKLGMNASSVNYPGDTETPDYTIMANGGFFAEYTFHPNFSPSTRFTRISVYKGNYYICGMGIKMKLRSGKTYPMVRNT